MKQNTDKTFALLSRLNEDQQSPHSKRTHFVPEAI